MGKVFDGVCLLRYKINFFVVEKNFLLACWFDFSLWLLQCWFHTSVKLKNYIKSDCSGPLIISGEA